MRIWVSPVERARTGFSPSLEDLYGDRPGARVGKLARHWINATQPIDMAKAINYSRQAADAALAALAPGDALRYYTQALDLHGQSDVADPILGIDLAIGVGTAQRQTGDPTFRDTLLDAARRAADLGDTERLVAAALANSRGIFSAGGSIDTDKIEVLEMARDRLATDHPDRALVLATLCMELTFSRRLERLQALADEALTIAESAGDDATIVRVLNSVAYPLRVPSLLKQSLAWSADALVRAERVGDPALLFWAAWHRAGVAICAGDIGEMDRCLEIMGSLAEQLGQPTLNWVHTYARALQAQIRGDNEQAEQLATRALQIGTDSGQPDAAMFFGSQSAAVSIQRGTAGELIPLLKQLAAEAPEIAVACKPALARCYVEAGRIDDARRLLDDFAAVDFDLPLDPNWLQGTVNYAEVAIACQDPEYVGPLLDRLAPWADQIPAFGLTADRPVNAVLGGLATVLGRYDEADDYFARATAFNDRARAKGSAASTNLSWGMMLAERNAPGDNDRARDLLTEAHTAAAAHGYAGIERRAAEALRQLN